MPVIAARILRALSEARLTEPVLATVGANALFGYERLAQRPDRNVEKRRSDRAQAGVVAGLVSRYLPHLTFDDPALAALPAALRRQSDTLLSAKLGGRDTSDRLEPDW